MKEQETETVKNIVVYVMGVPPGTVEALKEYGEQTGSALRVMLLWDSRVRDVNGKLLNKNLDFFLYTHAHNIYLFLLANA